MDDTTTSFVRLEVVSLYTSGGSMGILELEYYIGQGNYNNEALYY